MTANAAAPGCRLQSGILYQVLPPALHSQATAASMAQLKTTRGLSSQVRRLKFGKERKEGGRRENGGDERQGRRGKKVKGGRKKGNEKRKKMERRGGNGMC